MSDSDGEDQNPPGDLPGGGTSEPVLGSGGGDGDSAPAPVEGGGESAPAPVDGTGGTDVGQEPIIGTGAGDDGGLGDGSGSPVDSTPVVPPVDTGTPVVGDPIPAPSPAPEPIQVYGSSPVDFITKHPWQEMLALARAARSKKLADRLNKIVELANKKGFVTRQDVQNLTHCGYVSAEIYLSKLVKQSLLKKSLPLHKPQKYQPV